MNNQPTTRVVTGPCRMSYEHVWEAKSVNGSPARYGASILIPKTDTKTVDAINAAIDDAIEVGRAKLGGKNVTRGALKLPLRDGDIDRPDDEAYAGAYFVNANSQTAPQIVDLARNPITDCGQVYSGCIVRVSLNFYAFNKNGNRGIACGLGNIQKVRDGERLGGRMDASEDFSDNYGEGADDDFLK